LSFADWIKLMMLAARSPARCDPAKSQLAQGYRPDPVLDVIVVDRQITVLEIARQRRPAPEAVVDRFSCGGPIRHLTALSSKPLPQGLCDGFRSLLSQQAPAIGVEFMLASLAFDLVQCRKVSQALFGDLAAVVRVQIVQLTPRVSHAAHLDDAAIKERFVTGVVIADELSHPATKERLRMDATAAIGEVVDDHP
jgi:hypothetical protein